MGGTEFGQEEFIRQHGIDMASCTDAPGSASCQKAKNERDAVGLSFALATGSVAFLPGSAQVMWGLGATANAGMAIWQTERSTRQMQRLRDGSMYSVWAMAWSVRLAGMPQVARLETGLTIKIH